MNACWTNGWRRLEVLGAIEEAAKEKKAEFEHLVDSERTADAINDLLTTNSEERGTPPAGQMTQRRGGVGNLKPRTSNGTLEAKERRTVPRCPCACLNGLNIFVPSSEGGWSIISTVALCFCIYRVYRLSSTLPKE